MSADTKWIIGIRVSIITTILGTGAALAGLPLTQIAGVDPRIDEVNTRIDSRLDGLDERLRNVEVAIGKVDQRC